MPAFFCALLLPILVRADEGTDASSCGAGPKRVAVRELATIHEALAQDGAVILTGLASDDLWEAKAASVPSLTFPGRLVSKNPKVQGIHLEHEQLKQNQTANPFGLVGKPLLPHTDGYIYGKFLPDYIAFLVESQSEAGGENYVVDGKKVALCQNPQAMDTNPHRPYSTQQKSVQQLGATKKTSPCRCFIASAKEARLSCKANSARC